MKSISTSIALIGLILSATLGYGGAYVNYEPKIEDLSARVRSLEEDYENLQIDYDKLNSDYESLNREYNELSTRYDELSVAYNQLEAEYTQLLQDYEEILASSSSKEIPEGELIDLLEFNEIDEHDQIEVKSSQVLFRDINRMETNVTLYKEIDLTDFKAFFSVKITDLEPSREHFNRINIFTISSQVGDYRTVRFDGGSELCVRVQSNTSSNTYELEVRENHEYITNPVYGYYRFEVNQTYYHVLERTASKATLNIYSDSGYIDLLEKLVLDLNYGGHYPYVMFPQCGGYSAGNYTISGILRDLKIKQK